MANIGLEGLYPGCMQAVADPGHLRRRIHLDQRHRRAVEGMLRALLGLRCPQAPRARAVGSPDEEVRTLPVVPEQERPARFQPAIEVNHGDALPLRARDDAIAGLKYETTESGHSG